MFRIIKELKDPNVTHKYTAKTCIDQINKRLDRAGIVMLYRGEKARLNNYHFGNFTSYYCLKDNERFCYRHTLYNTPNYGYSIHAIDFIIEEIKKAPDTILDDLKQKCKKKS